MNTVERRLLTIMAERIEKPPLPATGTVAKYESIGRALWDLHKTVERDYRRLQRNIQIAERAPDGGNLQAYRELEDQLSGLRCFLEDAAKCATREVSPSLAVCGSLNPMEVE